MTQQATHIGWGPYFVAPQQTPVLTNFSSYKLDDADDSVGWVSLLPKTGTIAYVGFYVDAIVGTPPNYYVQLCTVDTDTGAPASGTTNRYGGSSLETYTPSTTGWQWIALTTPASGTVGDPVAVKVTPVTEANSTNYISILTDSLFETGSDWVYQWTTAWVQQTAPGGLFAIKYDTGFVHGNAVANDTARTAAIKDTTTPDEVGCKFTLPIDMEVYGAAYDFYPGNSMNYILKLYGPADDLLFSRNCSPFEQGYVDARTTILFTSNLILSKNTIYRLTVRGGSSALYSDISLPVFTYESAAAKAAFNLGADWCKTERTNDGAWTDTELAVVPMGLLVATITFGAGGARWILG